MSSKGYIQINKEKEQCWGEETEQWGPVTRLQIQNKGEEDTGIRIVLKLNECLSEGHFVSSLAVYPEKTAERPRDCKKEVTTKSACSRKVYYCWVRNMVSIRTCQHTMLAAFEFFVGSTSCLLMFWNREKNIVLHCSVFYTLVENKLPKDGDGNFYSTQSILHNKILTTRLWIHRLLPPWSGLLRCTPDYTEFSFNGK